MKKRRKFTRRKNPHRTNSEITAMEIRLVGDNVKQGIFPVSKAIKVASDMGLDLVEISPKAMPPVCRVLDYGKFLYEQKKKLKEIKANAVKSAIKEIRFGPNTDEHDLNFKLNHAKKFLSEGHKVRAFVFFRGRSILFKDRGEILLAKFTQQLIDEGLAKVETQPKMEGKKLTTVLAPIK